MGRDAGAPIRAHRHGHSGEGRYIMMQLGLLWFDDDPARSVDDKIMRAVMRYERKHGVRPNVCQVNPAQYKAMTHKPIEVQVRKATHVMVNYFWVGVE